MTPDDALGLIAEAKDGMTAAMNTADPDEIMDALGRAYDAMQELQANSHAAENPEGEEWAAVGQAFEDLLDWLEQTDGGEVEEAAKGRELTREEKIKIAMAVATRGRSLRATQPGGKRRRDLGDLIIDGFEAGAAALVKLVYHTVRLTIKGIAAVARGVVAGVIHVREHYRNGKLVAAHDRQPAAKSAYELYEGVMP